MNDQIKNLDYSKILFVDIETAKGCNNFDENYPYYDVWAWKQRNKDSNDIPDSKEVIQLYNDKAALFAEWGVIICISVGYIHNNELIVTSFTGDEKTILQEFVNMVRSSGRVMCGHNLKFDIPYTRKRFFINGMTEYLTEKQGNDVDVKPWLLSLYDTMDWWKGVGYYNTSLEELAMVFDIPSPKDTLHGNEVSEYYYAGKIDEIRKYCESDVATVANIIRRWRGEEILEPIHREKEQPKQLSVLERILASGTATERDIEELKKVKLTKKEKKLAREIVAASWGETKKNPLPPELEDLFK